MEPYEIQKFAVALRSKGISPKDLDKLVVGAAKKVAETVNRGGMTDQIKFLLVAGYTPEEIIRDVQ